MHEVSWTVIIIIILLFFLPFPDIKTKLKLIIVVAFRDALALRYGWQATQRHSNHMRVWYQLYSVEHALSCAKGGYPSIRHNEIRDFYRQSHVRSLSQRHCRISSIYNPSLAKFFQVHLPTHNTTRRQDWMWQQMVSGEADCMREHFLMLGYSTPSNKQPAQPISQAHENIKKRAYDQRIRDIYRKRYPFTPFILSSIIGVLDVLPPPYSIQETGISP